MYRFGLFSPYVTGLDLQCTKGFIVLSVGIATRFAKLRWQFPKT